VLFLIVLFLLLGLLLLLLEAFTPGLVMGLTGCGLIGLSAYLCFAHYGAKIGAVYLLGSLALAGTVAVRAFFWAIRHATITPNASAFPTSGQEAFVGKVALVVKELNPTGYVEIAGERRMARSAFIQVQIPKGGRVVVTGVDGAYLVVRPEEV
jgi:membrane-bound ClpP family serine protease